ncbi:MAG: RNA polymerase subunit sigma-70, partial [Chloroflexota bacterium]|nr:RNA polymerase subunit sigma-70 [Chloroflexota bacterium]
RADEAAVRASDAARGKGALELAREIRGAEVVAGTFSGRVRDARLALVDGLAGAAWAPGGRPRAVFRFTIADGRIVAIDLVADPDQLGRLDVAVLDG